MADKAEISFFGDSSELNLKSKLRANQNDLKDHLKPITPTKTKNLLFFSFMAGWEKEGGQWFQSALVGYLLIPFHWNAGPTIFTYYTFSSLVAKVQEMYPEADGNYMGFKRKGAEENMSWKCSYTWNSAICMKYILVWIPSVGRITELMDSLSSSDDRIGGFPQQVGCWNCQQVDSLSSSDDRIGGCPQQLGCHLVLIWSILDPLTWFLTHFGPLRWILPVETSLSLGPIKTLSQ